MVAAIVTIMVITVITTFIAPYIIFDRLIKILHYRYRDQWLSDGQPCGFFWTPDKALFENRWARRRLQYTLPFKTPTWVANDKEARKILSQLRYSILAYFVSSIIFLFVVLYFYT